MEKVYGKSILALIWNIILLCFGIIFALFILEYFFGLPIAVVISAVLAFFMAYGILKDLKTKVVVSGNKLEIYTGKEVSIFDTDKVRIAAKNVDNDTFTLYVTDEDKKRESFDVSVIGYKQFQELIRDLKIVGEQSEAIKLKSE